MKPINLDQNQMNYEVDPLYIRLQALLLEET